MFMNKKKVSDVGFPFLFGEQQGEFNHIFQDPFASLLETSEREILGICLRLVSGYNSSEKMSFGVGVKLLFELPPQRPFIFFLSKSMQRVQTMDKILTWLHWVFDFT
jgi:hypothetical protein